LRLGDVRRTFDSADDPLARAHAVVLGLVASQRDADAIIRHINRVDGVRTVQNYVRIVK